MSLAAPRAAHVECAYCSSDLSKSRRHNGTSMDTSMDHDLIMIQIMHDLDSIKDHKKRISGSHLGRRRESTIDLYKRVSPTLQQMPATSSKLADIYIEKTSSCMRTLGS